jgi:hypothetical protein
MRFNELAISDMCRLVLSDGQRSALVYMKMDCGSVQQMTLDMKKIDVHAERVLVGSNEEVERVLITDILAGVKAVDQFPVGTIAVHKFGGYLSHREVEVVSYVTGHPDMRRVKHTGGTNDSTYPVDTSSLERCAQFREGDHVRSTSVWSEHLFEVVNEVRGDGWKYECRACVIEDGVIERVNLDSAVTFEEGQLVRVQFYHVFGLYGDDTSRWSRALWAKDAQEAEDVCREEPGDELEIAATLRINGTIDEQH